MRIDRVSLMDYPLYIYNANKQLTNVVDQVNATAFSKDFDSKYTIGQKTLIAYSYDNNGNMIQDLNRRISHIDYNVNNLPEKVTIEDGHVIEYGYNYEGQRLYKKVDGQLYNRYIRNYSGMIVAELKYTDKVLMGDPAEASPGPAPEPVYSPMKNNTWLQEKSGTYSLTTVIDDGKLPPIDEPLTKPTNPADSIYEIPLPKDPTKPEDPTNPTDPGYPYPDLKGLAYGPFPSHYASGTIDKIAYIIIPGANGEPIGERRFSNGTFDYDVYYLKDHLGHIRVKVKCESWRTVIAAQDFYPYGEVLAQSMSISEQENKFLFQGKERDWETGLDYVEARYYDPAIGMFRQVDPHFDKYLTIDPFNYAFNNPMMIIDPTGMDTTIYFFDQNQQPKDNYVNAQYTAEVYVVIDGKLYGPFKGSTYPDSKKNENSTDYNTIKEGVYDFNNAHGHKLGKKKGLNIVKNRNRTDQENRQGIPGTDPKGNDVEMKWVNIHKGYNSRRFSEGCPTISPNDWDSFANLFDWSGGTTGTSKGKAVIVKGANLSNALKVVYQKIPQKIKF